MRQRFCVCDEPLRVVDAVAEQVVQPLGAEVMERGDSDFDAVFVLDRGQLVIDVGSTLGPFSTMTPSRWISGWVSSRVSS